MLLFRILCIPKMPAPAFWLLTVVRWVTATMLLSSPAILFRVEAWQPHSNIGIPFKVNVGSKLTRVYRTFQVRFIITKPLLFYNCKIFTVLWFLFRFRNKNWLFAYFVLKLEYYLMEVIIFGWKKRIPKPINSMERWTSYKSCHRHPTLRQIYSAFTISGMVKSKRRFWGSNCFY